jgi:hypothetical protein
LANQFDRDILLAKELTVLFAETVHAFTGCPHFLGAADAFRKIVQGFLELCGEFRWNSGGGLGSFRGIHIL